MSSYREQANEYKAKRAGIVEAKAVTPRGRKKKVDKPWCVVMSWNSAFKSFKWDPMRTYFAKEHDARAYMRKHSSHSWATLQLEFNGELQND